MKRNKKGFTIVELVIVIGVIGILSAILIPTFVNLVGKADYASDIVLVSDLNKVLQIDEAETDDKPISYHAMLNVLEEQGYKISYLTTKSGHDLLYNLDDNRFYLSDDDKVLNNPNKYEFWKLYEDIPSLSEQSYSIFLNNDTLNTEISIRTGFDSYNTLLPKINYVNTSGTAQNVIIYTHGCDLTIDAVLDSITHYGECNNIVINNISESSFYDYGRSDYISLHNGRIVVEEGMSTNNIHINTNNAIIAKGTNAVIPQISRSEDVTSIEVQVTTEDGEIQKQSAITIDGDEITSTGNVSPLITNQIKNDVKTSISEDEARLATKYEARIGDYAEGDESNYYDSLQDALDTLTTATASTKVYLLKNIEVTSPIVVSDTNSTSLSHYLYLNGFSIKGIDCSPLSFSALKKLFYVQGSGSLIGDETHPCLINSTNIQITMTSVDTVGGFVNSATTQYLVINNGNHTSCSFEGTKFRLDTPNANSIYDCDLSSVMNPHRNTAIDNGDGTYTLRRTTTTEATENGWTKVCYSSITTERYASISEFIAEADYPSFSITFITNITEDVNSTTTLGLTINANKKTFTGKLITKGTMTLNSKSATGRYNISQIGCTSLTINNYANVTIGSGSISKTVTLSGTGATLTINGGTFTKAITVNSAKTNSLVINGGTFKAAMSVSGTSSSYTISVRGGTYNSGSIYTSFSSYIAEGYEGGQDSGKTTYSVHPIA